MFATTDDCKAILRTTDIKELPCYVDIAKRHSVCAWIQMWRYADGKVGIDLNSEHAEDDGLRRDSTLDVALKARNATVVLDIGALRIPPIGKGIPHPQKA